VLAEIGQYVAPTGFQQAHYVLKPSAYQYLRRFWSTFTWEEREKATELWHTNQEKFAKEKVRVAAFVPCRIVVKDSSARVSL